MIASDYFDNTIWLPAIAGMYASPHLKHSHLGCFQYLQIYIVAYPKEISPNRTPGIPSAESATTLTDVLDIAQDRSR